MSSRETAVKFLPYGHGEVTARMPEAVIAESADSLGAWHPWPTASERDGWDGLSELVRSKLLARATHAESEPWPNVPASLLLDYSRTGNRRRAEDEHFMRRHLLRDHVLGACVAGDGRHLDSVLDAVWSLCEETFWGIPAHSESRMYPGTPLPVETEPIIDLFAAETAADLAWVHYLLRDQLAEMAPTVVDRIVREISRRILDPFLERDDWRWLALKATHAANWTPWICSNIIICSLVCETNPRKRTDQLTRAIAALDVYVASFPADGGCSEGQTYWTRGPGALFDCFDALESASDGRLDGFSIPVVSRLPNYLVGVHLNERLFVQHSDGNVLHTGDAITLYRFATRVNDTAAQQLALHLRDIPAQVDLSGDSLNRSLQDLFTPGWQESPPAQAPAIAESWLPDLQVGSAREHPGSIRGLTLIVKGGHNAEDHNHNDVGSFTISLDGAPVVIDPGVGAYTRATFGAHRYDIWTMRSGWHNLPVINGREQAPGSDKRARNARWTSERTIGMTAQIGDAWPEAAGVISWERDIRLSRAHSRVVLRDEWELSPGVVSLELPIVLAGPVELADDGAVVRTAGVSCRIDASGFALRVEEMRVEDQNLEKMWGPSIYRLVCSIEQLRRVGSWSITFSRA